MRRIAVIGGGFSGATLVTRLHRCSTEELEVDLFEPSERVGAGVAYSTPHPYHLLNVAAGKMSTDFDRPDDFVAYLEHRRASGDFKDRDLSRWGTAAGAMKLDEMFAPRRVYADYVVERFSAALTPSDAGVRVRVVTDRADELTPNGGRWSVRAGSIIGGPYDAVVLATGNAAPCRLLATDVRAVIENPWNWDRLSVIDSNHEVLLIGTGLTMIDALLTLCDRGHRGRLTAVSTRGLLPRPHRIGVFRGSFQPDTAEAIDPRDWLLQVRRHLRTHPDEDWRAVIDAFRPVTQDIWQRWSQAQRRSFLRRIRPFWEVHRHRLAPWVAEQLADAIDTGRLVVRSGRVHRLRPRGNRVEAEVVAGTSSRSIAADTVVNCTGPDTDLARSGGPLISSLLGRGTAAIDPLGLGLDIDRRSNLNGRDGAASPALFAVGPPCKAARWEITAVPDVRAQVSEVVEAIIDQRASRRNRDPNCGSDP